MRANRPVVATEQVSKYDQGLIPDKRRSLILAEILETGHISVEKIIQDYNISKMTAWRDLKFLDEEKKVKKVHGGAIPIEGGNISVEPGFDTKVCSPEKLAIAKYAARFVHENDVIMIDGGSTPMEIIPFLTHDNLTIITNSPTTALLAARIHEEYAVICAGGLVRDVSRTCVGPDTEAQIRSKHANAAFLSGLGLTPKQGLTEPNTLEIGVKLAMCESAETRVVIVEATKLARVSLHKVMPSDEIDIIVTDNRAPERVVSEFETLGVDVRVVAP